MKEQVEWATKAGQKVTVTVELITSKRIWADGDEIETKCCEMNITAEVEGVGVVAYSAPFKSDRLPAGVVAVMGKLALNQENYDRVMAAIEKVEASPEWQAKLNASKAAIKAGQALDASRKKIYQAMNP